MSTCGHGGRNFGRLSPETCDLLRVLARARAEAAPAYLHRSTALAFERRWSKLLAISVASALARSIVCTKAELSCSSVKSGHKPFIQDVLTEGRVDVSVGAP